MKGLGQRALAELLGTGTLVATVVGSGIMAGRLSPANDGVALWANTAATMCVLVVLILTLGPVSGAHLNPVVTVTEALRTRGPLHDAGALVVAQVLGALGGVLLAHAMFELPLLQACARVRTGPAQILSEAVATAGLLVAIRGVARARPAAVPFAVAAWIGAAYWFTSSTSFANPAVTLARAFTDTFAGIRLADVPGFVLGQCLGAAVASAITRLLFPSPPSEDQP